MKNNRYLTIVLLLFYFIQYSLAQSGNDFLTISFKNIPLSEAVKKIENNSKYTFFYDASKTDLTQKVSLSVKNKHIRDVISELLKNTNLAFEITNLQIVLLPSSASPEELKKKQKKISGTITDDRGEPIIGANVLVKGTTVGVISDYEGHFVLEVPESGTVQVSYIGYETKEFPIKGKNDFLVRLSEDSKLIDEVVVVGYGSQKKSDLTGAVSSIKTSDIVATSDASIGQLLKGKAAGVTILSTNALPGGGVDIRIRGAASTGAGNDPLFVIDGFPVTNNTLEPGSATQYSQGDRNPLNTLNPNDIESIEILKDASATAIYGARASNGVVLITTKRGKKGLKMNYDGSFTTQVLSKPFEMLNAHDYMVETNKLIKEKWLRENKIAPYGEADPGTASPYVPRFTDEQMANVGAGTNWWDLVTRSGMVNNHNISVTYGDDNLRSYASLGYFRNDGVVKQSFIERISAKINLDWTINKYITTGISYLGSVLTNGNIQGGNGEWGDSGMLMSALLYDPTVPVKDEDGNYSEMSWYTNMPNPVSYCDVDDKTKQTRNLANFYLEVTPIKDLQLKAAFGYDGQSSVRKIYYPKTFLYGKIKSGQADIGQINRDDILFDLTASYKFEKKKHRFSAMVGYSFQQFNDDGYSMSGTNYFTDAFKYNNIGVAEDRPVIGSYKNRSVLTSYFGRINYTFLDRYLLTINARYDGCDKFGKNNKWGFFPSASLGWRITEEEFMKQLDKISNLKLRVSYGQTGNSNIGTNAFSFYEVNRRYAFNSTTTPGVSLSQLENPDLKWETTTELNVGLDFGFCKNRLAGSLEFFHKIVSDLLGWRDLRSWMLVSGIASNLGKTQSRGVELTLNTLNINNSNFKWNTDFTFTRYVDKWKKRSSDVVLKPWEKENDYLRPVYYYKTDGIVQIGENVPSMPNAVPGNIKVMDINGFDDNMNYVGGPDGKIDEADIVYLGKQDPDFSIGFNNTFKYKNFDLSFYAYGSFNQLAYNFCTLKYIGWSDKMIEHGTNLRVEAKDRWSSENPTGKYPSDAVNTTMGVDAYVYEKASFLRMKNITLGYNFPRKMLGNVISSLRVYVNVENPFVITKWSGMDPETDINNKAPYPNQQSYSFGLNLQF